MTIEQRRIIATEIPGPKSRALEARRRSAVPPSVASALPVHVAGAQGAILVDVDGNHLIDFGSGAGAAILGHAAPNVIAALRDQSARLIHAGFSMTPYETYVALAERLTALTPGDFVKRTVLFNSRSEAVEGAVKIARKARGRAAIVAFDHAVHGATNLALALTAGAQPAKSGFGPFAGEIYRVPSPYPLRWPTGAARCLDEAFEAFVMTIHHQVGERNVAAVILEPIQSDGGVIVPPAGFVRRISDWCRLHDIAFIADETQTALARTGDMFASAHDDVAPDLIVMAGGLASGLPLAAVTGRSDLMDAVQPGALGGVSDGNPLACAAALATIDAIEEWDLCARARDIEQLIKRRLSVLAEQWDVIGEVRGRGAMIALEIVLGAGELNPHPLLATAIAEACCRQGLVLGVAGTYRNCLRLMPPLTILDSLLEEAMEILEQALATAR
jgi:4-aminobutyrate aminotransferase/(S)-3-amino-2-methylpropionate transaminase